MTSADDDCCPLRRRFRRSASQRLRQCPADDFHAGLLRRRCRVLIPPLSALKAPDQRHAAAGDDAFFNRRAGRVQRVFDAGLLFFHFRFGRRADIDLRHAAGELRQAFLQLFAIVIAGGDVDLAADLLDAALNRLDSRRRLR